MPCPRRYFPVVLALSGVIHPGNGSGRTGTETAAATGTIVQVDIIMHGVVDVNAPVTAFELTCRTGHAQIGIDLIIELELFRRGRQKNLPL